MEMVPRRRLELVSGRSHPELAQEIAAHLGVALSKPNLREFANGEIHCRYDISLRGADVFIVQTHCGPVNDTLMEQLIMIDAAKRASAKRITAVCPYYGYSRQIQGFFDIPFDHLTAMPVLVEELRREASQDMVVVAPDAGRVKVAERF